MKAILSGFLLLLCWAAGGGRAWGDHVEVRGFHHVGDSWRRVQSPESGSGSQQPLFGCATSLRTIEVTNNPKTQQLEYTSHDYKVGDWTSPSLQIASGTLSGEKGQIALAFENAGTRYDLKGRYDASPDASLTVSQSGQVAATETCESFFVNSDLLIRLWEQQGDHYIPVRSDSAVLARGEVILIGKDTGIVQIYDPRSKRWSYHGVAPYPSSLIFTPLPDHRMLAVGGSNGQFGQPLPPNVTYIFDPANNIWKEMAPMKTPLYFHADTVLADGRVLIVGQPMVRGPTTAEIFDPKTNTWSDGGVPHMTFAHNDSQNIWATRLQDDRIFVSAMLARRRDFSYDMGLELFDPKRMEWTSLSPDTIHFNAGALPLQASDGTLFLFGYPQRHDQAAGIYSLASQTWTPAGEHEVRTQYGTGLYSISKNRYISFHSNEEIIGFSMTDKTWHDYPSLGPSISSLSSSDWACETLPSGKILFAGSGEENIFDETGNWEIYDPDAKSVDMTSQETNRESPMP